MKNKMICIAIIIFALATAGIRLIFNGVPHAADKNTAASSFSSERAMVHLDRIAYDKRHLGSPLHAKTQVYIEQEMKKLGYEVLIQDAVSVRSWLPNYHFAVTVKNISARKKGTASTGAVMIMSHYDSVTFGPGAADAGYGVTSMLESARALTKTDPLKNDIIFLFTDAEEAGLMGANAFLSGHPWLKDVKVIVNLEARGTEGASQLFETGRSNGLVVREFIKGTAYPVGSSITNALYGALPNDTDYTLFKAMDIQGLNFANGGRITAYHTPLDNLKNADPETLQHHGENALGLAKRLGNISLDNVKKPDLTYFNIIGSFMVSYPVSLSYLLTAFAVILFIALAVIAFRKNRIRPFYLLASSGIVFLIALIVTGSVFITWKIVNILHPQYSGMFMGDIYNAVWYRAAFTALSALLVTGVFIALRKKFAMIEITAASIILWLAVLIIAQVFLPAGSYIFLCPLVFAIVLFALYVFKPYFTGMEKNMVIMIFSVPVLFFMVDILSTLYIGLTLRFVIVSGFITALFFILLLPLIELLAEKGGTLALNISGIIFIAALIGGSATSGFNSEKPKPNTISYALDSDTGKASWLSCDSVSDTWLKQFFKADERKTAPELFPMLERCVFKKHAFFSAPAPALDLKPPLAEIVSDITTDKRELKFRISSGRKAGRIFLMMKTDSGIENVSIEGSLLEEIDPSTLKAGHRLLTTMADLKSWKVIDCKLLSDTGYTISLKCKPGAKIEVRLLDISDSLPDITKWGLKLRPNDIMAGPDYLMQEGIMVAKKYML